MATLQDEAHDLIVAASPAVRTMALGMLARQFPDHFRKAMAEATAIEAEIQAGALELRA